MKCTYHLAAMWLLLLTGQSGATPAAAERVEKNHKQAIDQWLLEVQAASTPDARTKAWGKRPDPATFAKEMWASISPALSEEWTLDPAAWFLSITSNIRTTLPNGSSSPAFTEEINALRSAIETHHMRSTKLPPVCLALASRDDPQSLALLEKIHTSHAVKKVQGVAALALAMRLKSLGDDAGLMSKRLTLLRQAIIDSSDVVLGSRLVGVRFVEDGVEDMVAGGTTVAKLAEDELYIIRFLTKGRTAPDLVGTDSGMQAMQLSTYKGKVIVLLFWNSGVQEAGRILGMATTMEKKFTGKPFAVIGVNNDTTDNLRNMQKQADLVTFHNFSDPQNRLAREYRVGSWPLAYVLDGERKIHYAGQPGSFVDLTVAALLDKTGGKTD
jgi:peroxiredoxin